MARRSGISPEDRIKQVLRAKNVDAAAYWRERGEVRFRHELIEDGLAPDEVAAILDKFAAELFPPVNLDELLRELKERTTHPAPPPAS
ncbi:MAG: hypothetical protein ACR2L4_02720 [Actinomycetota bacterium]